MLPSNESAGSSTCRFAARGRARAGSIGFAFGSSRHLSAAWPECAVPYGALSLARYLSAGERAAIGVGHARFNVDGFGPAAAGDRGIPRGEGAWPAKRRFVLLLGPILFGERTDVGGHGRSQASPCGQRVTRTEPAAVGPVGRSDGPFRGATAAVVL